MMPDYLIVDEITAILDHFEVNTMHSTRTRLEHRLFDLVKKSMASVDDVCQDCLKNDVSTFCVLCLSGEHSRDQHRLTWHDNGHRGA